MVWKVVKKMQQIFHQGNDEGYSLLDAMVSIFIAGVVLIAVTSSISGLIKLTQKNEQKVIKIIETKNADAEKVFISAKK